MCVREISQILSCTTFKDGGSPLIAAGNVQTWAFIESPISKFVQDSQMNHRNLKAEKEFIGIEDVMAESFYYVTNLVKSPSVVATQL